MPLNNVVPRWYDEADFDIDRDKTYAFDGETMRSILWCAHRLYDEAAPLKGDDRRDLAQRLYALLNLRFQA